MSSHFFDFLRLVFDYFTYFCVGAVTAGLLFRTARFISDWFVLFPKKDT